MEKIFKKVTYDWYLYNGVSNEQYKTIIQERDYLIDTIKTVDDLITLDIANFNHRNNYVDNIIYLAKLYVTNKQAYRRKIN